MTTPVPTENHTDVIEGTKPNLRKISEYVE
jgi:hypothetical protein